MVRNTRLKRFDPGVIHRWVLELGIGDPFWKYRKSDLIEITSISTLILICDNCICDLREGQRFVRDIDNSDNNTRIYASIEHRLRVRNIFLIEIDAIIWKKREVQIVSWTSEDIVYLILRDKLHDIIRIRSDEARVRATSLVTKILMKPLVYRRLKVSSEWVSRWNQIFYSSRVIGDSCEFACLLVVDS